MIGIRIGYVRVSAEDQNPERQLENLKVDKTFIDKCSGKSTDRPQFQALMEFIRQGDTLVVHSMDRLARNLMDLRKIVQEMVSKGIKVEFMKENLIFTGEDSPISMLTLSIMGAFAEFERAIIRERQREGIELAKKRGVYKVGRKKSLNNQQHQELIARFENGATKASIARYFKISRPAVYDYIKLASSLSRS